MGNNPQNIDYKKITIYILNAVFMTVIIKMLYSLLLELQLISIFGVLLVYVAFLQFGVILLVGYELSFFLFVRIRHIAFTHKKNEGSKTLLNINKTKRKESDE